MDNRLKIVNKGLGRIGAKYLGIHDFFPIYTLGEEKISNWANAGGAYAFETFTSSGKDITSAINTEGGYGGCNTASAIVAYTEVTYKITISLIINSGSIPQFSIDYNPYVLVEGENIIYWTPSLDYPTWLPENHGDAMLAFWDETNAMNFSAICSMKEVL